MRRVHVVRMDDREMAALEARPADELATLLTDLARRAQVMATDQAMLRDRAVVIRGILNARRAEGWHVTDHAVIRYLERVRGYDVAGVRTEIRAALDRKADAHSLSTGAVGYVVDGVTYVVSGRRVLSLYPADEASQ